MTADELMEIMPSALGFFAIDSFPGVIAKDHSGWIFEGGDINPRPITREELTERGGVTIDADEAAHLLGRQESALEFLTRSKKNNQSRSLTQNPAKLKSEMRRADLQMKVKEAKKQDT
jgi:hypothetical protein